MDDFLIKFFPVVYAKKHHAKENNYCKYDNQLLQLFTSSLYLAAIAASFVASIFCKKFGRKLTIQFASVFFVIGAILSTGAVNLLMLIAGRICLGAGVGFGNQVCTYIINIFYVMSNIVYIYVCLYFVYIKSSTYMYNMQTQRGKSIHHSLTLIHLNATRKYT